MISKTFLRHLADPPKAYRPIPFWSWNERLAEAETRRQIAEMDRVGLGGYFMHARGGLQTPYMGDEWLANIAAGIDEGRRRGMGAWAYDENGWPSGFGDGRVNGRGEAFQQKYLRHAAVDAENPRPDGRTIAHVRLADGRLLHFYYDVNPFYVDTLDGAVTRTFLEEIYAPYARRFAADFGQTMPGFFTDEPQVSRNGIPWSLILPAEYRKAYGDDLLPHLPELFLAVGDFRQTRYRFWHLVQELFVENFTRTLFDWCTEHGCRLTGHMVLEETFLSQITSNGAVMPHYEYFHMPGMDWLCRHINPPTTPLQVASVAHQLGKPAILSETFALTGWNATFEDLKWIYEWQLVRGITHLCQHLEGYSLRGIRKRDYPPSLFFQQPWWERYRPFNDAMSRLGLLLSRGEPRVGVLVLHPQSSAWLHFDNARNTGVDELFGEFMALTQALEAAQVPFHYGDERILRRHGRVSGSALRVGRQTYQLVLVPATDTLAASTVRLLTRYAARGGAIVWVGRQPSLVEGAAATGLTGLTARGQRVATAAAAVQAVPAALRPISVTDPAGQPLPSLAATWRRLPRRLAGADCRFTYFVHSETERDADAVIRLPGAAVVQFLPEDGSLRPVPCERDDDRVVVRHHFPRRGSLVLLTADDPAAFADCAAGQPAAVPATRTPLPPTALAGAWDLTLHDPNSLVLDVCDVWFDGQLQASHEHVSVIQKRALDLERPVDIRMRFAVECGPGFTPPGELYLVLERPDRSQIAVNGTAVPAADCGWYRDTSFRKVDIRGQLRPGTNEIVLTTRFRQDATVYENLRRARVFEAEKNKLTYDSEIEAVYLVGEFGVGTPGHGEPLPREALRYTGPFVLGPQPTQATLGDLTLQGLPFFNGTVTLGRTLELTAGETRERSFRCGRKMAAVAALRVNGQPVKEWMWRPYEADLAGLLRAGPNRLEIELVSGLRNLLGPHHLQEGESYAVHPGCFFKEPNLWGNLPWNDGYCLVEFGVQP